MAIIVELSPGNVIKFGDFTGQSTGSTSVDDLSVSLISLGSIPIEKIGRVNSTLKTTNTLNTYYKVEGFNVSTQRFETWHCQNQVLLTPPSGNALVNVSIIAVWQDR